MSKSRKEKMKYSHLIAVNLLLSSDSKRVSALAMQSKAKDTYFDDFDAQWGDDEEDQGSDGGAAAQISSNRRGGRSYTPTQAATTETAAQDGSGRKKKRGYGYGCCHDSCDCDYYKGCPCEHEFEDVFCCLDELKEKVCHI